MPGIPISRASRNAAPGAPKGPHGGRPRGRHIKVWITPDEEGEIAQRARATGLSLSGYLRNSGLHAKMRSVLDVGAVGELARLNGDLGRLAALMQRWLDERSGDGAPPAGVQATVTRFRELQIKMHEVAGQVLRDR